MTKPIIRPVYNGRLLLAVNLYQVPVNWDRSWGEAIKFGAPQTPGWWSSWSLGNHYPKPSGKHGVELTDLTLKFPLLEPPHFESWDFRDPGVAVVKEEAKADPWQILAIGEALPQLYEQLNIPFLGIACLKECRVRDQPQFFYTRACKNLCSGPDEPTTLQQAGCDRSSSSFQGHFAYALVG